jgi:hypothetical protein
LRAGTVVGVGAIVGVSVGEGVAVGAAVVERMDEGVAAGVIVVSFSAWSQATSKSRVRIKIIRSGWQFMKTGRLRRKLF